MEHPFVEHGKDFYTQCMKRQPGVETEHVYI